MAQLHDFQSELSWAEAQTTAPYWDTLYHHWFPDYLTRRSLPDGVGQRSGRDTVVLLTNGEQLCVQEKARRLPDTNDILLEYEHKYPSGYSKPGWMQKDERYDYLAYVFVPSRVGYLFPFQPLRAAWRRYREDWMALAAGSREGFRLRPAKNRDYVTWSLAVPTLRLYRAVGSAMRGAWPEGPGMVTPVEPVQTGQYVKVPLI